MHRVESIFEPSLLLFKHFSKPRFSHNSQININPLFRFLLQFCSPTHPIQLLPPFLTLPSLLLLPLPLPIRHIIIHLLNLLLVPHSLILLLLLLLLLDNRRKEVISINII